MRRPTVTVAVLLGLAGSVALPASASAALPGTTLLPLAGTGAPCPSGTTPCGDGDSATAARLGNPHGVAVMPDGAVIVADTATNRIRRIGPDGKITTVAGNGTTGWSGDGGALTTSLWAPEGVAAIDADSFLVADTGNHRIRRVDGPNITTVAGDGTTCSVPELGCGDGSAATQAQLNSPRDVATRDGGATFLIADRFDARVRRVAGGVMTTVAGTGAFCATPASACGDGGPSAAAELYAPQGISLLPGDGFLIADPVLSRVRRVTRDDGTGVIERAAGLQADDAAGFSGDGGPATGARLNSPDDVVALPTGGFAVADTTGHRIRIVDPAGRIDTAAGDGAPCPDATTACGDGGPAPAGRLNEPRGVTVDARGDLVVGDSSDHRVRLVDLPASISPPGATTPGGGGAGTAGAPEVGRTVLVQTLRGRVYVRLRGSRRVVPLDEVELIPDGSKLDTRRGTARLTVARGGGRTDTADLSQGVLTIDQRANGTLVDLRLSEQLAGCPAPVRDPGANGAQQGVKTTPRKRSRRARTSALLGARTSPLAFASRARAAAKRKKRRTRRGRVKADGRFRTDGRYGSAIVRGTQWLTIDDCRKGRRPQTRVVVTEGKVGVRDFARARTTLVKRGQRYVAYARRG